MWYWIAIGWVLSGMIGLHVDYVLLYSTRPHNLQKRLESPPAPMSPTAAWVMTIIVLMAIGPLCFIRIAVRSVRKSKHFALFTQQVEEADANGERHPDEPTFDNDPNCVGCAATFLGWADDPTWAVASQSVMVALVTVCLDGPEETRRTLCDFHQKVLKTSLDRNRIERAGEPAIYDCGCSRLKVRAGLCDVYGTDGKPHADSPKAS